MKLRQVALVAEDLATVSDAIQDVFGLGGPYGDPGIDKFGLCNAVYPVGDTFLEIVCPTQEGTTAGRYLERRKGDGGYMAIFQTRDIATEKKRMADLGVNIVYEADVGDAKAIHLHPRDVGGAIVSLDVMAPPESWRWAGPDWEGRCRKDVTEKIVGVEVQALDPAKLATRWADVLDASAESIGSGFKIALDEGTTVRVIQAVDGRGDGVSGVDLKVHDKDAVLGRARKRAASCNGGTVTLCGTNFYLK